VKYQVALVSDRSLGESAVLPPGLKEKLRLTEEQRGEVKIPAHRAGLWVRASVRGHVAARCFPPPRSFAVLFCKRHLSRHNNVSHGFHNQRGVWQTTPFQRIHFGIALSLTPFTERGFHCSPLKPIEDDFFKTSVEYQTVNQPRIDAVLEVNRQARESKDTGRIEAARHQLQQVWAGLQPYRNTAIKQIKPLLTPDQIIVLEDANNQWHENHGSETHDPSAN